jgi:hypothetical protein
MVSIDRIGTPDRQRNAMRDQWVVGSSRIEVCARHAALGEKIFADDLEPVHRWTLAQHVDDVRASQSDPDA